MALVSALVALLLAIGLGGESGGAVAEAPDPVPRLTPGEKAALVVVSGLPAPRGVGGVIVQGPTLRERRPNGAIVFVDQEGGEVRAFADLPPDLPPSAYATEREVRAAGRRTGLALDSVGVDVDLAPVLDGAGGPLGSRHFGRPELALAFAQGLAQGGTAPCVKHFPGLGTAPHSTDERPDVVARLAASEVDVFRDAVRAEVPCVMVGHAFYRRLGARRASFSVGAYQVLRESGFDGVAITDSVSVFGSDFAVSSARLAIRAGADLVLYTNGRDAARAIRALVPLARAGALDEQVRRVIRLRREVRSDSR